LHSSSTSSDANELFLQFSKTSCAKIFKLNAERGAFIELATYRFDSFIRTERILKRQKINEAEFQRLLEMSAEWICTSSSCGC
jgi:hypothetical protein